MSDDEVAYNDNNKENENAAQTLMDGDKVSSVTSDQLQSPPLKAADINTQEIVEMPPPPLTFVILPHAVNNKKVNRMVENDDNSNLDDVTDNTEPTVYSQISYTSSTSIILDENSKGSLSLMNDVKNTPNSEGETPVCQQENVDKQESEGSDVFDTSTAVPKGSSNKTTKMKNTTSSSPKVDCSAEQTNKDAYDNEPLTPSQDPSMTKPLLMQNCPETFPLPPPPPQETSVMPPNKTLIMPSSTVQTSYKMAEGVPYNQQVSTSSSLPLQNSVPNVMHSMQRNDSLLYNQHLHLPHNPHFPFPHEHGPFITPNLPKSEVTEEERIIFQHLKDAVLLQDPSRVMFVQNTVRRNNNEQWIRVFNMLEQRHQNFVIHVQQEYEAKLSGGRTAESIYSRESSSGRSQQSTLQGSSPRINGSISPSYLMKGQQEPGYGKPIERKDLNSISASELEAIHKQYEAKLLRTEEMYNHKYKVLEKEYYSTTIELQAKEDQVKQLIKEKNDKNFALKEANVTINETETRLTDAQNFIKQQYLQIKEGEDKINELEDKMEKLLSAQCDKEMLQRILTDYNSLGRDYDDLRTAYKAKEEEVLTKIPELKDTIHILERENAHLKTKLALAMEVEENDRGRDYFSHDKDSSDKQRNGDRYGSSILKEPPMSMAARNRSMTDSSQMSKILDFSHNSSHDRESYQQKHLEKHYDSLQAEKQGLEDTLTRIQSSASYKTGSIRSQIREEKMRLEEKLMRLDKELGSVRSTLRHSNTFHT